MIDKLREFFYTVNYYHKHCSLLLYKGMKGKKNTETCKLESLLPQLYKLISLDIIIHFVFPDGYSTDKKLSLVRPRVTIQMFEVYNEIIKDLMAMPLGGAGYVDLKETASKGVHVRVSA